MKQPDNTHRRVPYSHRAHTGQYPAQRPHPTQRQPQPPPRRRRRGRKKLVRLAVLCATAVAAVGIAWGITLIIQNGGEPEPASAHPGDNYDYDTAAPQSGPAYTWMPEVNNLQWNRVGPLVERTQVMEVVTPDAKMIALPENGRVDLSYFDTAVIIGDSLAQGFAPSDIHHSGYGVLADTGAKYCTYRGVNLTHLYNGTAHMNQDGVNEVPMDALAAYAPDNVYLSMGPNAMLAIPDDAIFLETYGVLLDTMRQRLGPDVGIYVMSITPVSDFTTEFDKDRILALNNYLAKLVWEKGMYFLDTHEALADENGWMRADLVSPADGYHLKDKQAYEAWLDYLLTHTVYNARHADKYLEGSQYYSQAPLRES